MDLGSGNGKAVVAAAYAMPFKKLIGVEYLENLHEIALGVKKQFDEKFEAHKREKSDLFKGFNKPDLQFLNMDFLNFSWVDATVIFCNSTCFSADLLKKINFKLEECAPNTVFISFTKKLPNTSNKWEVREGFKRVFGWGTATIYLHRKIN